jgi:hypothetical protein
MRDEVEFIKNELKKKGYSLESYVQSLLIDQKWNVQPHAYFLDRDTGKGRELDLKAYRHFSTPSPNLDFLLHLLIQCKKLPGNAWIFFSDPKSASRMNFIKDHGLGCFFDLPPILSRLDANGTHFERCNAIATNYCEILTDEKKSNKRTDNIWNCVISLIKATAHELGTWEADTPQYLDDVGSFEEFVKKPFEVHSVFYPLIVFEGKIYTCEFHCDEPELHESKYVQLLVDYQSGFYKGCFGIDIIAKEKFHEYLTDITKDIIAFENQRKAIYEEYEKELFAKLKTYYQSKMSSN